MYPKFLLIDAMTDAMNPGNYTAVSERSFFETMLDNTCARLQDKQTQFNVRRLDEMDLTLKEMESELDVLVNIHASNNTSAQRFL